LTAERFQRFIEKARQAGTTPAAVLQRFILTFIGEDTDHDTPQTDRKT
jgi:hypothetical protein